MSTKKSFLITVLPAPSGARLGHVPQRSRPDEALLPQIALSLPGDETVEGAKKKIGRAVAQAVGPCIPVIIGLPKPDRSPEESTLSELKLKAPCRLLVQARPLPVHFLQSHARGRTSEASRDEGQAMERSVSRPSQAGVAPCTCPKARSQRPGRRAAARSHPNADPDGDRDGDSDMEDADQGSSNGGGCNRTLQEEGLSGRSVPCSCACGTLCSCTCLHRATGSLATLASSAVLDELQTDPFLQDSLSDDFQCVLRRRDEDAVSCSDDEGFLDRVTLRSSCYDYIALHPLDPHKKNAVFDIDATLLDVNAFNARVPLPPGKYVSRLAAAADRMDEDEGPPKAAPRVQAGGGGGGTADGPMGGVYPNLQSPAGRVVRSRSSEGRAEAARRARYGRRDEGSDSSGSEPEPATAAEHRRRRQRQSRPPPDFVRPFLHELFTAIYPVFNILIWSATGDCHVQHKLETLGLLDPRNPFRLSVLLDYGAMIRVRVRRHLPAAGDSAAGPPPSSGASVGANPNVARRPVGDETGAGRGAARDPVSRHAFPQRSWSRGPAPDAMDITPRPDAGGGDDTGDGKGALAASTVREFNTKPLQVLFSIFPSLNRSNTVIVDDHRRSFVLNPEGGIHVTPFSCKQCDTDREFELLARYLLALAEAPSVASIDHSQWREVARGLLSLDDVLVGTADKAQESAARPTVQTDVVSPRASRYRPTTAPAAGLRRSTRLSPPVLEPPQDRDEVADRAFSAVGSALVTPTEKGVRNARERSRPDGKGANPGTARDFGSRGRFLSDPETEKRLHGPSRGREAPSRGAHAPTAANSSQCIHFPLPESHPSNADGDPESDAFRPDIGLDLSEWEEVHALAPPFNVDVRPQSVLPPDSVNPRPCHHHHERHRNGFGGTHILHALRHSRAAAEGSTEDVRDTRLPSHQGSPQVPMSSGVLNEYRSIMSRQGRPGGL
jgi:hypothetical protein